MDIRLSLPIATGRSPEPPNSIPVPWATKNPEEVELLRGETHWLVRCPGLKQAR